MTRERKIWLNGFAAALVTVGMLMITAAVGWAVVDTLIVRETPTDD